MVLPADYPNAHAARVPDRVALVFKNWRWTYGELDEACNAMAGLLRSRGITPGTRVAYIGKNNDLFFIVLIGIVRAGAVLVPVNWRNTAPETAFILDDSGADLIIADAEFLPLLAEAAQRNREILVTNDPGQAGLRAKLRATAPLPREALNPVAPSLQLYTSGTTGKPKGVLTSQHALGVQRQMEIGTKAFDDWRDDEILLSALPSFHVGGMSWVLSGFCRGQGVVITDDLAPSHLLDLCLEHDITRTFIVPTVVRAVMEEMTKRGVAIPTLRSIHYGAASMDPLLLERSISQLGCRFVQYYGMTEATGSITLLDPRDHDLDRPRLLRSVGRPLPGVVLEIRDANGQLLRVGEPGEIWLQTPSLLLGYWNRPDATAEALHDGWYRSGDGGYLDEDGFLFLTDRIKDMIVSGGENVYPAEVEAALRGHPAVLDCAVFGMPHQKWGEGVTAAVELRPGHTVTQEELIAFTRTCLAGYKIPRRIEFGVTLPRTASGKVQRAAIRKYFIEKTELSL
ncbi:AMP-binding protein [Acidocella sp. KAb 2-4]|nr:AMP-binding protein [Acidocella sp. KAb 2-4]